MLLFIRAMHSSHELYIWSKRRPKSGQARDAGSMTALGPVPITSPPDGRDRDDVTKPDHSARGMGNRGHELIGCESRTASS